MARSAMVPPASHTRLLCVQYVPFPSLTLTLSGTVTLDSRLTARSALHSAAKGVLLHRAIGQRSAAAVRVPAASCVWRGGEERQRQDQHQAILKLSLIHI